MANSISVKSVKKANYNLIKGRARAFSSDGITASVNCQLLNSRRTLSLSTEKIINAANNALARYY